MKYKIDGMTFLDRMIHRTDSGGFVIWAETYLEDRGDQMTRADRAVIEKAQVLLGLLCQDSHHLEDALGCEAAAHSAARRVNIQQEIELRDLRKRCEVLERQVHDLRLWLDSGEIQVDETRVHPEG